MKDKTRQLLDMAAVRRTEHPRRLSLESLLLTKEGKRLQRRYTKARKTIANRLRDIQRDNGHQLARVWARAAG